MKFIFKLLLKCISLGFVFAVTMGIGLALYAATLLPTLPTVDEIREIPLNIPLRIYSADDKLIAEYGNERRIPLALDETPPLLIDAILATEDDRFYHHTGVDFPGLVRAAISNISSGTRGQGASTITMQVARNFFLNPEKTYTRKLKEILLAFNMERALTKDEILELYLNKIFLGHRSYGFAAAAQTYYGSPLGDLSVPEIAMLAGLPKAPSRDNPISNPERAKQRRGYVLKRLHELGRIDDFIYQNAADAPITARRHIADVDLQAPYVSEMARQLLFERFGPEVYELGLNVTLTVDSEYQKKANQALRRGLLAYDTRHGYRGAAASVDISAMALDDPQNSDIGPAVSLLLDTPASRELQPVLVIAVDAGGANALTREGERIRLPVESMDWAREYIGPNNLGEEISSAGQVLNAGDIVYAIRGEEDSWSLSQLPDVSGALVSLDPNSGAILALTGGFDYFLSKFNRATQAERQPGSNIKPFIYSAALDNGFTPASLVSAAPIVVEDDLEGIWRPQNYSKKFFGPTRLRKALSLSLNLVSVRLLRAVGVERTIDHLAKFGFDPERLPHNLSLALGSIAVTPLDLASRFAVLANGGSRVTPYLVESITDPDGKPIELPPEPCEDCEQGLVQDNDGAAQVLNAVADAEDGAVSTSDEAEETLEEAPPVLSLSPQNAYLTTSMMKQVILSGTGQRALALGRSDLAGKTGTTNDFKDAWFSGYNPDVITTVYVGFDEPAHLGRRESGASAALPIWVDFMGHILKDFPERPEVVPDNITTRFINEDTALVTSPEDPKGYTEYYLVGTEPNNRVEPVSPAIPGGQQGQGSTVTESLF